MDHLDAVWNRAAVDRGGPRPLRGDSALTAVLRLHSLAMSGGLLDAIEQLAGPGVDAAESGYTWLGHPDAAHVIAYVRDQVRAGALDSADRLEHEADHRYADVIPGDATLNSAFRRRIAEEPSAFADTRE